MKRPLLALLPLLIAGMLACGETYSLAPAVATVDGGQDAGDSNTGGDASSNRWSTPVIALGPTASCFVGASGKATCVGSIYSQFCVQGGDGSGGPSCTDLAFAIDPKTLPLPIRQVSISNTHVCFLAGDAAVGLYCGGKNGFGQIDATPVTEDAPFVQLKAIAGFESGLEDVATGSNYTCALKAGVVSCWGYDLDPAVNMPVKLPAAALELGGGDAFRCARTATSDVYCWGYNIVPRSEAPDAGAVSKMPVLMQTQGKVASLRTSSFSDHACVRLESGVVSCWGLNNASQTGVEKTTYLVERPTPISAVSPGALDVVTAGGHSCALRSSGEVRCWGSNFNGVLGAGTNDSTSTAVSVVPMGLDKDVTRLFGGGVSTCALQGSGISSIIKCWGGNAYGQLQDGSTVTRTTPVIVPFPP